VVTISREREREAGGDDGADRWVWVAVRERGGRGRRLGWFSPGWLSWFGPQARPRWADASSFLFFVLFSFSFVFCFSDLGFELANLV
jgi:hypothetical protein